MKLSSIGFSISMAIAGPVFANNTCESIFSPSPNVEISKAALLQLVELTLKAQGLEAGTDKALLLEDLRNKFLEIEALYGKDFRREFADLLRQEKSRIERSADEALERDLREKERKIQERDSIFKWSRTRLHEKIDGEPGPWLSETEFLTMKDGYLALYDYQKQTFVYTATSNGPKASKNARILLGHDRSTVYVIDKQEINVYDLATKSNRSYPLNINKSSIGFAHVNRDQTHLFIVGRNGGEYFFRLPSFEQIRFQDVVLLSNPFPGGIVESSDGHFVFTIQSNNRHTLYDVKNDRAISMPTLPPNLSSATFSADAQTLVLNFSNKSIIEYNLATGTLSKPISARFEELRSSPDGQYIMAYGASTKSTNSKLKFRILDRHLQDLTPDFSALKLKNSIQEFALSNETLAFYDLDQNTSKGTIYIVDLRTGSIRQAVTSLPEKLQVEALQISPDGHSVFIQTSDFLIELF